MTLVDPVKVNLTSDEENNMKSKEGSVRDQSKNVFAVPQQLQQHFVIVPSKLRLVTLAAFILDKCVVNEFFLLALENM